MEKNVIHKFCKKVKDYSFSIDYILKKLQLKSGETLLDIGSGWGWLIIRAEQQYGVKALGITLSEGQYTKTKQCIAELGLTG